MIKSGLVEPRRLKGFRDYLPDLMGRRFEIMDVVREKARLAGFQPVGTPALEYATTLLGHGEETDKQVYRFRDHGDRDVALRFDLTVPFARFVAEHQGELVLPFKRVQIGDVWRGENTQKGRYREFTQCDVDIIGVDSAAADIEVLAVLHSVLNAVPCGNFTMAVGHRGVLSAVIRRTLPGLSPEGERRALVTLDKLGKVGEPVVLEQLAAIDQATDAGARLLLKTLLGKNAAGDTDLEGVQAILQGDEAASLERLARVVSIVRAGAAASRGRVAIDLTIARGLAYYTGVVFETTLDSLPGFGSVCSGGRYDQLAARFTQRDLPGVGGSLGLDRMIAALEELGRATAPGRTPIFVAVATDDAWAYGFQIAAQLRGAGIASSVGLVPKLGLQFRHADRLGARAVVTVGSTERENSTFSVKTMADGIETRDIPLADLVKVVAPLSSV